MSTLMRHVWCSVKKAKLLQGVVLLYEVSSVCVHRLATWQHPIYPEQWRTNSSQHALGSQASNVTFGAFRSPRFHIGHVCPVKQLRLWFMCNLSFRVFGQGSCSVRPVGQDGHAGQDGDVEAVMFIRSGRLSFSANQGLKRGASVLYLSTALGWPSPESPAERQHVRNMPVCIAGG